jgi:membrane protein implicated in regulation of membrane protease activity
MRRNWAIFALIIAILAAFGGGRYLAMAILTALLPIYALLLASIILIVFLITASIAIPIGRRMLDRKEAKGEAEKGTAEKRKAA